MESVSVGAILKIVQAIAKAVATARRNEANCNELAERAQQVASLLPTSKAVARGDAAAASILRRLKAALDDALRLVESCGRCRSGVGGGGCLIMLVINSGGVASKFTDVNGRINNCLVDLQAANAIRIEEKIDRHVANGDRMEKKIDRLQLAAGGGRDHHRRANSSKEMNAGKNGNNKSGWNNGGGQQNGGKGGKKRRGKKAAGPRLPPPPSQFRPHAGGGVQFCPVHHHHHSMEEDPTSCSVM